MSPIPFFQRHPRADLSASLDGELTSGALLRLETHIASCAPCAAELEELRKTRSVLRAIPEIVTPRSFVLTPEMARANRPARPETTVRRVQPLVNGLRMTSGGLAVALAVAVIVGVSGGGSDSDDAGSSARNLESTAEQYSAALPTATIYLTTQGDASVDDAGDAATNAPNVIAPTPTPTLAAGSTPVAGGVGGAAGVGDGSGTTGSAPDATANATTVTTDKTSPPVESPLDVSLGEADQGSDDSDRNSETGVPDAVSGDLDGAEPLLEDGALAATGEAAGGGTDALTVVTIVLGVLLAAALIGSIAASRLARKTP